MNRDIYYIYSSEHLFDSCLGYGNFQRSFKSVGLIYTKTVIQNLPFTKS